MLATRNEGATRPAELNHRIQACEVLNDTGERVARNCLSARSRKSGVKKEKPKIDRPTAQMQKSVSEATSAVIPLKPFGHVALEIHRTVEYPNDLQRVPLNSE
jgi:hypothetical protein